MHKPIVLSLMLWVFMISCHPTSSIIITTIPKKISPSPSISYVHVNEAIPGYPVQEFRGLWIASVANIDWPSKKGLSSETQKKEFTELTRLAKQTGINALLVQVRAATDAFYEKSAEPWSEWLTGKQGQAPSPLYDPMEFMIQETHDQGLEFHAWLNLNRGMHKNASSVMSNHLTRTKPEWFLTYDGYKLFNFGIPEVRDYITDVVVNIVKNYEVDGIHFDDYFYPYKVNGQELKDQETFRKYPAGFRKIEDWRRNNIDLVIRQIAAGIKKEKPWVVFGISPFGVWRNQQDDPAGSATRGGQPSYDLLFADTRKWAQESWIDYITPQIYFPFEHKLVPYATLTDWWAKNNGKTRLYIGHAIYQPDPKSSVKAWQDPNQIPRQISYNRLSEQVSGSIFFSANALLKNNLGLTDSIRHAYRFPALTPDIETIADTKSSPVYNPQLSESEQQLSLKWQAVSHARFLVYHFRENEKINLSDPRKLLTITSTNYYETTDLQLSKGIIVLVCRERGKTVSDPVFIPIN